jgi:hypothetical protein
MSQQQMNYEGSYRDGPSYDGYEGSPHYNTYSMDMNGQKLSGQAKGQTLTAAHRLALAIVSLVLMVVVTFGVILIAMLSQGGILAGVFALLVIVLFYLAVVAVNVVFNRSH